MLKILRHKKTRKRIFVILAVVIVPAFAFWGFGGILRSQKESNYAGKIFGRKISFLEYKDALEAEKNKIIINYFDNRDVIPKNLNLEPLVWTRLILLYEAKKRNIGANDKEVIEWIEHFPFFQRNGQFNNEMYSESLRYDFQTQPRIFEERIRQNLMLVKLYKEVTDNLNLADDKELKEEYRKLNEEVSLYYIAANPSDFTKDVLLDAQEIKDYFLKNAIRFKQPLTFNIEYVSFSLDDKDKETINDRIKKLFLRLKRGQDFAKAAKDFELTLKETGLFAENDPIPGIGWALQITNLISKANIGQYLNPIQVDKYYYILKVKEKKEPYIPDFETIKDKVRERFVENRSGEMARQELENCLKDLKELSRTNPKSLNFDLAAKTWGLKSGSTGLFKYGSYIEGIGASDKFWTIAQELKDEQLSEIIEIPSGFYIIKLKSRAPIDEKKFAAEKTAFSQMLLLQRKQEYFAKFIEELSRRSGIPQDAGKRKAQRF